MSDTPPADDVHAPYVQGLADSGDWSALVRYWIAHQHMPALDRAIELVQARPDRPPWPALAAFLDDVRRDPIVFDRPPPDIAIDALDPSELATLGAVLGNPYVALCELAQQFPTNTQDRAFRAGIEAADRLSEMASSLPDPPLLAFLLSVQATGYKNITDLEAARESYDEALRGYRDLARQRPEVYRPFVATTLNNLGNVQSALNDLEAARESYDEALRGYRELARQRPEVYRPDVAMTLNNLGNVQRALNDLEAARESYDEALRIRRDLARQRPEVYRPFVATTLNNLGTVQSGLNDMEAARTSYDEATGLYERACRDRPTAYLVERMRCWDNLGQLHLRDSPTLGWPDRPRARDALRRALDCAEAFRGRFADERLRREFQERNAGVYQRLIATCVDLWRVDGDRAALEEAVDVAEASRARRLMELMLEDALRPQDAPAELVEDFFRLRRRLEEARRRLDAAGRGEPPGPNPGAAERGDDAQGESGTERGATHDPGRLAERAAQDLAALQARHDALLGQIRAFDSTYDPDRPVPPIRFEEVPTLVARGVPTAIVHYTLMAGRGLAVVITADDIRAVELPGFDATEAIAPANDWYHAYYDQCREPPDARGYRRLNFRAWGAAIDGLLAPVAERAVRPVVERLAENGIRRLILVPSWVLHLFPLHACRLGDGRALIDVFDEVIFAPSLAILHRCAGRARRRRAPAQILTAENPTGDLAFPEVEAAAAGRHFARHVRCRRAEAHRARLLGEGRGHDVWHYSGHSAFRPDDPMASGLLLADGPLTLRDIYTDLRLPDTSLAVLSGCESGGVRPDRVDDYAGLPSGILYAGATCVLSSLWSVDDPATALLIDAFYREWREGHQSVAAALGRAQRWLRDATGTELRDRVMEPGFLDQIDDEDDRVRCSTWAQALARPPYRDTRPLSSPAYWAAFLAVGWAVSPSDP